MGLNSLPKTVTWPRRDCDLNLGPSVPESSTLTTRLPSHPHHLHAFKKIWNGILQMTITDTYCQWWGRQRTLATHTQCHQTSTTHVTTRWHWIIKWQLNNWSTALLYPVCEQVAECNSNILAASHTVCTDYLLENSVESTVHTLHNHENHRRVPYDTIRDAILKCALKPTWVSLIYRTEN